MTREQWLAERRKGLGASDIPAALNFSPFRTSIEVWCEKTGNPLAPAREASDVMEWGRDVEAGILHAYERMTGRTLMVRQPYGIVHHPDYPELFCTPDAMCLDQERIVQCKWSRRADGFGDPGTDEIPDAYLLQCALEMACVGCDWEDLAAMVVGPPVLIYPLHRNLELERDIIDAAREWWHSYVVKNVEPPIGFTQPWGAYLSRKFPQNTGEWLELGDGSDPIRGEVESYLKARRAADEAADAEKLWQNTLKSRIADRDGLRWQGGEISWKRERDHKEDITDWASLFMTLCGEFKVPVERQKELMNAYTQIGVVTRKGSRKFIVREKDGT